MIKAKGSCQLISSNTAQERISDELYSKFKQTKVNFNQKSRARKIFNLIDRTTTKDFKQLINASKQRCVRVKSGVPLAKELNQSLLNYNKIADKVCSKQFYFEDDLIREKGMLRYNLDKNNNEKIAMLFSELRGEKEKDKETVNKAEAGADLSDYKRNKKANRRTSAYQDQEMSKALIKSSSQREGDKDIGRAKGRKSSINGKHVINNIINGDRKKLNDSIDQYLSMTKSLCKEGNELHIDDNSNNNKGTIIHNTIHHSKEVRNCLFLTGRLRFLNFNRSSAQTSSEPQDNKKLFDIKKMMNYTQHRCTINDNKDNDNNTSTIHNKDKETQSNMTQIIDPMSILSQRELRKQNLDQLKLSLLNERSRNKNNDFSETINIIKRELIMNQSLKSSFKIKSDSINQYFIKNKDTLPSVEAYTKPSKKKQNQKQTTNDSIENNTIQIEQKLYRNHCNNQRKFANSMCDIFKAKQNKWLQEDLEIGQIINRKQIKESKKKKFVAQIKNIIRFPIKFNDAYSIRDGKSNKCNEAIARFLGNQLYTKEEMADQILRYYQKIKEEEVLQEEEKMKQWKEEKEIMEQMKKAQRTTCNFVSKDNNSNSNQCEKDEQDSGDINAETLSSLFVNYYCPWRTVSSKEDCYKEYLDFKHYCEKKLVKNK